MPPKQTNFNINDYFPFFKYIIDFFIKLCQKNYVFEITNDRRTINDLYLYLYTTKLLDKSVLKKEDFYTKMKDVSNKGGTPLERGAKLCAWLGSADSDGITGKLISAVWDPWIDLQNFRKDLDGTDIFTLRRIVPKDRGLSWEK